MGETISTLVFRPPKPTPIDSNDYFHLHVDVKSPLYFPKRGSTGSGLYRGACNQATNCTGGMICGEDSDLISLDRDFLDRDGLCVSDNIPQGCHPVATGRGKLASGGIKYKVPAFFVRRRGAKHTILFSHGNAEDLGMMYKRMKDLALVLCVNVMAYDYTGYGLSSVEELDERDDNELVDVHENIHQTKGSKILNNNLNVPSENMIYRNIEAAYVYLTQTRGISPRNIILYGRSLGSGPSCYLAAKTALMGESVGGLILHSPFLSIYKVVADVGMDVKGDMFNNEKRAVNIRCPTLIIHGKEDEVVPFWHAPRLLAAIPPEFRAHPFYVDNLGHNHIESRKRDQYIHAITEFLMKCAPPIDENESNAGTLDRLMHRGGTRKDISVYDQKDTLKQNPQHANVIPENQRASADEVRQNGSTFYINQTWMRHAKVICREVFSDNIICNSALTAVDWGSGGSSREGSGTREGDENKDRSNIKNQRLNSKKKNGIDSRDDDADEFAPWKTVTGRQRHQSKTRLTQSDTVNAGEMMQIQRQKKILSKNTSMPVNGRTANEMRIKMSSATRRKSGGRGGLLGFRK